MATTRSEIRDWLERGKAQCATHMIVVCDTFDYGDYPVFVTPSEKVRDVAAEYDGKNMQKIMEVYKLSMPWEPQIEAERVFNY